MELKPIEVDISTYPTELHSLLSSGKLYDSSCSPEAQVIFIDKDYGYFLKSAPKGKLEREAINMRYFHRKGLSANVLSYMSNTKDWLLSEKIQGEDCISAMYLEQPTKLCDTLAERLNILHSLDFEGCPMQNHTKWYLDSAKNNKQMGTYNKEHFPDSFGYTSEEAAWTVVKAHSKILKNDTLLHGDYCLPNIILDNWQFAGFIDLDNAGVGDKHVDVFWVIWSLYFNLHTHKYRARFIDAYGRDKIDEDILRIVAAVEVFG